MLRRIFLIGGAGLLGAAALAVVQIRVGSLFGVSGELDAFFIGAALPSVLMAIGAAAIGVLVVPRLPRDDGAATGDGRRGGANGGAGGSARGRGDGARRARSTADRRAARSGTRRRGVADQAERVLRIYALSIPGTAAAFVFSSYGYATGRVWASGLSTSVYALCWLGLLFVPAFTDSVESATVAGLIATGVQVVAAFALSVVRPAEALAGLRRPADRLAPACLRWRGPRRHDRRPRRPAARSDLRLAAGRGRRLAALLRRPDRGAGDLRLRPGRGLQPADRRRRARRRLRLRLPHRPRSPRSSSRPRPPRSC